MKKEDLVKIVANESGLKQTEVSSCLAALASTVVKETRDNGEEITIPGLGKFVLKHNPARIGRNPLTGKDMQYNETKTIAFKTSSSVKVVIEAKKAATKTAAAKAAPAKKAATKGKK